MGTQSLNNFLIYIFYVKIKMLEAWVLRMVLNIYYKFLLIYYNTEEKGELDRVKISYIV